MFKYFRTLWWHLAFSWMIVLRCALNISLQATSCFGGVTQSRTKLKPTSSAGTRRNYNVFITSKRRRRRRFDVMKTLSLRHYCVMCPLGLVSTEKIPTRNAGGLFNDHLSERMRVISLYLYLFQDLYLDLHIYPNEPSIICVCAYIYVFGAVD